MGPELPIGHLRIWIKYNYSAEAVGLVLDLKLGLDFKIKNLTPEEILKEQRKIILNWQI